MSERLRLAWFGAVCFVAIVGLGNLVLWIQDSTNGPGWWAIDLQLVLDAGDRLGSGRALYADPRFLYPPLAAVLGRPLATFDPLAVSLMYAGLKVILAVAAILAMTPRWGAWARTLATIALICSLPFLHDLMLGNANILLVGAIGVAVLGAPDPRRGMLLGLAAAVFAKPFLVPVFLWLLVFRRPVLAGAVTAGLVATALGVVLAGPSAYVDWLSALVSGGRFAEPFAGNHGVSALDPSLWVPVAALTGVALIVVLARRGPRVGLVWAVTSGILLAPYAGTYSALPVALAVPVFGAFAPALAIAIVAISPVATTIPLPFYAAGILVMSLALREPRGSLASLRRSPGLSIEPPTVA